MIKIIAFLATILTFISIIILKNTKHGYKSINESSQEPLKSQVSKIYYSSWIPFWDEEKVLETLPSAAKVLSDIRPFWYRLNKQGIIEEIDTPQKKITKKFLIDNKIKTIPTIGNDLDPNRVALFFQKENDNEEIEKLIAWAKENNYAGYDIDWEEININDKENFSNFIKIMSTKFKENNLTISVTVHAKTGTSTDWKGSLGQDYKSLGEYADQITIMVYDFHNANSDSGPVTPIKDLINTLNYAVRQIPIEKITVALPTYGYDWVGNKGKPIQYQDAIKIAQAYNIKPNREKEALTMMYEDNSKNIHKVWFEDAESIIAKMEEAKKFKISRFCFWRLGGEDPRIWTKIQ